MVSPLQIQGCLTCNNLSNALKEWQIMDAHGNCQTRKKISLKSIPLRRWDFFSTWTLNYRPVCFKNSLSQHVVVIKEKVIQWGHLNSGSACASGGASVLYKPLKQ